MQLSSWAWHHHHRWWHPPLKVTNPFQWNNINIDYKSTKRSNFGVTNIAALHTNQTERSSQPLLYWNMYQISVKMTINSRHHHFEELVVAQIRWSFVAKIVKNSNFSPFYMCLFICLSKELRAEQAKSHWLHLFDFSPLCLFKCLLKWLAFEDT